MYKERFYMAELAGSQEVPPVLTDADGTALFHIDKWEKRIRFRLDLNVNAITGASIALGSRRINGPTIVYLLDLGHSSEDKNVVDGFVREQDLVGPLEDKSLSDLTDLMMSGKTYVNVHTKRYPNGEIRGKICH